MSASGHSLPGRTGSKSGHVRLLRRSGSKFGALARPPRPQDASPKPTCHYSRLSKLQARIHRRVILSNECGSKARSLMCGFRLWKHLIDVKRGIRKSDRAPEMFMVEELTLAHAPDGLSAWGAGRPNIERILRARLDLKSPARSACQSPPCPDSGPNSESQRTDAMCQHRKSLYSITLSARVVRKVRVDMLGRLRAPAGKCRGQGRVASTDVGLAGQPLSYQQRFRWLDATTQISQHRNIRPSQIP
jgi:hypothetical protein